MPTLEPLLRIAIVHSFYSSSEPSGETVMVNAQREALVDAGLEVELFSLRTDALQGRKLYSIEAALTTASGIGRNPMANMSSFRPDVVHVHNLFPNFGTKWLSKFPSPIVTTLHNFRPLCAKATLFRDGEECFECPTGTGLAAIRHKCYRDSRIATLPLAVSSTNRFGLHRVLKASDKLVVLSKRAEKIYQSVGLHRDKIEVIPNFVGANRSSKPSGRRSNSWVFIGRLSEEKGVAELLRTWPESLDLIIVGAGPLRDLVDRESRSNIKYLGELTNYEARVLIENCAGVVIPSQCFEGLPTVFLEALSAGTPVLAYAGNSAADEVSANHLGRVVPRHPTSSEVRTAAARISADYNASSRCKEFFHNNYSQTSWVERMTSLYRKVGDGPGRGSPRGRKTKTGGDAK